MRKRINAGRETQADGNWRGVDKEGAGLGLKPLNTQQKGRQEWGDTPERPEDEVGAAAVHRGGEHGPYPEGHGALPGRALPAALWALVGGPWGAMADA